MRFCFFLHDLYYDIGHSNVTVDMINNLPDKGEYSYHFVVFTADDKNDLFPAIAEQVSYHFVPFPNIRIAFLKIVFFHFYCFFYSLFLSRNHIKISLGIANLLADFSIIHFIHRQWDEVYFKSIKMPWYKLVYKRLFYQYLAMCEYLFFKLRRPKIITVSEFMRDYLIDEYNYSTNSIVSIHSGFDIERFDRKGNEIEWLDLLAKYPELKKIDFEKPVCLFVGAFERKGLPCLLQKWELLNNPPQLLIIGKSESGLSLHERPENLFYIPHVKEIDRIYGMCDYFLFPTLYEPFGMVLIEAAIHGLKIITTSKNVGASEVIKDLEEVKIYKSEKEFELPEFFTKVSKEERLALTRTRKNQLKNYRWDNISKLYSDFLSKER